MNIKYNRVNKKLIKEERKKITLEKDLTRVIKSIALLKKMKKAEIDKEINRRGLLEAKRKIKRRVKPEGLCRVCKEREVICKKLCRRCYGKEYYNKNRDKITEYYRGYDLLNPERTKRNNEVRKTWYHERGGKEKVKKFRNKPKVKESRRKWTKEYNQRGYVKAMKREYYRKNKEKFRKYQEKREKKLKEEKNE